MRVVKPMTLGVLTRPFEFGRQFHLGVAVLTFLPMSEQTQLLKETAMWPFLAVALPGQAPDIVIPKSQAEFLVAAHGYAPDGAPVPMLRVGAMLGSVKKMLQLVGPRTWDGRRVSEPVPFTDMPIDWAHAVGGPDMPDNPLGMGAAMLHPNPPPNTPLPTVLPYPPDPGASRSPVGFSAADQMWPARARYAGTYDHAWLQQDFPGFARDIDWRFFNIAPEDQQFPGMLDGDEPYAFANLHPEHSLIRGNLPGIAPRAFLVRKETPGGAQGFEEVPLGLTTVWFFPGELRLVLVHHGRAAIATETGADVACLMLGADRQGALRDAAYFHAQMEKRLDRKQAGKLAMRDEDLVPPEWLPDDKQAGSPKLEEGLARQRFRRRAEREDEAARAKMRENNVDPDKYDLPKAMDDGPLPTMDELPALAEKMLAEANEKQAEAEAKAEAAENELAEKLLATGKTPEEVAALRAAAHAPPKGPPDFSAAAMRTRLEQTAAQKRALGLDVSDIEAQLADPQIQAEWEEAEQQLAGVYLLSAHVQDPVDRLDEWQSAAARATLVSGGARSWRQANFCGADLARIDLSGRDLSGIWLDGADLSDADLSEANLSDAVLAHAKLDACRLDGANLQGANCGGASLLGASFRNANLQRAILSRALLDGADFSGADLTGTEFLETKFGSACFAGTNAPGLKVLKTSLAGLRAPGIRLSKACFLEVDLTGADFSGAQMTRVTFLKCRLAHANFSNAVLENCTFVGSGGLTGANFIGARLPGVNLRGQDLSHAILSQADLTGADLTGANLTAALLLRTNGTGLRLTDANLERAMMRGGNFAGADMARTDLRGADLRGISVYQANLARARTDRTTRSTGMQTTRMRYLPRYEER
jgi:uncharacterized protein YjbI with pentapeptide repeats